MLLLAKHCYASFLVESIAKIDIFGSQGNSKVANVSFHAPMMVVARISAIPSPKDCKQYSKVKETTWFCNVDPTATNKQIQIPLRQEEKCSNLRAILFFIYVEYLNRRKELFLVVKMIKKLGVLETVLILLFVHILLAEVSIAETQHDNIVASSSTTFETKRLLLPNETNPQCPSDYFLDTESLQCTSTCSQDMFISAKTCVKACKTTSTILFNLHQYLYFVIVYRSTRFLYH